MRTFDPLERPGYLERLAAKTSHESNRPSGERRYRHQATLDASISSDAVDSAKDEHRDIDMSGCVSAWATHRHRASGLKPRRRRKPVQAVQAILFTLCHLSLCLVQSRCVSDDVVPASAAQGACASEISSSEAPFFSDEELDLAFHMAQQLYTNYHHQSDTRILFVGLGAVPVAAGYRELLRAHGLRPDHASESRYMHEFPWTNLGPAISAFNRNPRFQEINSLLLPPDWSGQMLHLVIVRPILQAFTIGALVNHVLNAHQSGSFPLRSLHLELMIAANSVPPSWHILREVLATGQVAAPALRISAHAFEDWAPLASFYIDARGRSAIDPLASAYATHAYYTSYDTYNTFVRWWAHSDGPRPTLERNLEGYLPLGDAMRERGRARRLVVRQELADNGVGKQLKLIVHAVQLPRELIASVHRPSTTRSPVASGLNDDPPDIVLTIHMDHMHAYHPKSQR